MRFRLHEGVRPMPHPRRLHRLPALIVIAAGLGAGAACGSGGSPQGGAPLNAADLKTTDPPAKKAPGRADPPDAALDYPRCMPDHGVDMPDPATHGGPRTPQVPPPP